MIITSTMGNASVGADVISETMSVLWDTSVLSCQMSLQFCSSLPSYMTLQRNKISKTLTYANASVVKVKCQSNN